ncbi:hypothetical protein SAMN05216317_11338 [Nitrosomonas eutropha]|uniref:Uncharacterized protein n=1 Tax=Nitrosomonas eutropha TaxID=916 RepID=A0ABX5M7M6_9PROT|nr:hypothetical protein C8R14_11536 [Nitrosomonas eutropha]SCX01358.1 hypothetical protein SAMN05216379_101192 [Nitrosomonas eutropha]SDW80167.1 hypothetical protein SAMN05216317_11338 [Nitrosomonas eutropha]
MPVEEMAAFLSNLPLIRIKDGGWHRHCEIRRPQLRV